MSKYQEIIDKTTEKLKKYYDLDNMTKDQAKLLYGDVTYTTELLTAVLMKIRVGDILEKTDGEPNYAEDLYRSKAMLYCGMIVLDTVRATHGKFNNGYDDEKFREDIFDMLSALLGEYDFQTSIEYALYDLKLTTYFDQVKTK